MKAIENKNLEIAIVGIITDCIIWTRMVKGFLTVMSVGDPKDLEDDFPPERQYSGYSNADCLD